MSSLLAIVGATGTGKTNLAIKLSKLTPSVLISADSRQVYQGMDVVTGKDHPSDVIIHGIDLVAPDQACSVAVWVKHITPQLASHGLPIVVGGTGLYVKALVDGIPSMSIPPDQELRLELSELAVPNLQERLSQLDSARLTSMNQSDRNNPRRLIRAIEVASSHWKTGKLENWKNPPNSLIIGLKHPNNSDYQALIKKRVIKRLELGAIQEARDLLTKYPFSLPSFTSLGYRHLTRYLSGDIDQDQLVADWTQQEISYSKRQLTWFNKVQDIHWFNSQDPNFPAQVASLVKAWYSKHN